jgi:hypothetical protein
MYRCRRWNGAFPQSCRCLGIGDAGAKCWLQKYLPLLFSSLINLNWKQRYLHPHWTCKESVWRVSNALLAISKLLFNSRNYIWMLRALMAQNPACMKFVSNFSRGRVKRDHCYIKLCIQLRCTLAARWNLCRSFLAKQAQPTKRQQGTLPILPTLKGWNSKQTAKHWLFDRMTDHFGGRQRPRNCHGVPYDQLSFDFLRGASTVRSGLKHSQQLKGVYEIFGDQSRDLNWLRIC